MSKSTNPNADGIHYVRTTQLSVTPGFNPRVDATPSDEFLRSVSDHGVLQPLLVRVIDGQLAVIDGHRRLRAALQAEVESVPVYSQGERSDEEALLISYLTNTAQKTFSAQERAATVTRLRELGVDDEEIRETLGISERTFQEHMVVATKAPPAVRASAESPDKERQIPTRVAARLAQLDEKHQTALLPELQGLSVRDGLERIRRYESEVGEAPKSGRQKSVVEYAKDARKRAELLYRMTMRHAVQTEDAFGSEPGMMLLGVFATLQILQGETSVADVFFVDDTGAVRLGKTFDADKLEAKCMKLASAFVAAEDRAAKKSEKTKSEKKAPKGATEAPKKRGRPKKDPTPVAETPAAPKKRGRPKKVAEKSASVVAEAPKKRGRPRKQPLEANETAAVAPKKSRGRPKKVPESNVVTLPVRARKKASA